MKSSSNHDDLLHKVFLSKHIINHPYSSTNKLIKASSYLITIELSHFNILSIKHSCPVSTFTTNIFTPP